ncbi:MULTISPECIES: hypothetical protein [Streptomyces]|uniref:DUF732 domain-containing protein n=1 Tax=Streptomyces lasalocidi TaxID=324833 RepID=A0A4U5W4A3_STRLS|nr:hypothetical protein [Streptomyces lasalocidi]TKS96217.1 hypothetical protein E4U91_36455 [Streptomyces lasalocidi]
MNTRTAACTALLALVTAVGLTACGSSDDATTSSPTPSTTQPGLTDEQKAQAREAAGLPPTPQPADWKAYINALDAIDPDIVHGKEDKAVSRGIDTCSTYKRYPDDKAQQVKTTRMRFTSPTHPEGRDAPTAQKILDAAHKHICPTY